MSQHTSLTAQVNACNECEACLAVCPTYKQNVHFSPLGRLKIAEKVLEGVSSRKMMESIYSCTLCYACNLVCPNGVDVVEIVENTRTELIKLGMPLLEVQKRVTNSILNKANALGKDPSTRLEWLPKKEEEKDCKTLLYFGCILSYIEKDIAVSTYQILSAAGLEFKTSRDEDCCGIYIYRSGNVALAKEIFERNVAKFKKLNVTEIIVPCLGCFRCFKIYYPKVLGKIEFNVRHIVEVIYELVNEGKLRLKQTKMHATYHDPCYLGRVEDLYDEPREILRACGVEIAEMDNNKERAHCCGAGGGVRSLYKTLSIELANKTLNSAPTDKIISSCCFCTNQFKWAAKEAKSKKTVSHITEIVLQSING